VAGGRTHLTTGASDVDATAATPRVPTPARSRPYWDGQAGAAVSGGRVPQASLTATAPLRFVAAPPQRQVLLLLTSDALQRKTMTAA
jgi:hypothetical protein